MIELNFLDSNGMKILSLTSIKEVNDFFKQTVNCSTPQTLLMDIMSKHYRYIHNGREFYCNQTKIDNTNSMILINYEPVV